MTTRSSQWVTTTLSCFSESVSLGVQSHLLWEIHQLLVKLKKHYFFPLLRHLALITNLVKPSLRYWFYNDTINMYVDLPWQRAKKYLTIECLTGNKYYIL